MERDPKHAAVALRGITKYFPGTVANRSVNLEVLPGEALALLGENGAGKSTLMKILYGIYQPDEGQIFVKGNAVRIRSPQDAAALGIGMIHQHFSLVPVHSVLENVMLSCPALTAAQVAARLEQLGSQFGLPIDPDAIIEELPVGMQQRVEILKALCQDVTTLIMDEPTAVLTPQEAERLFAFVDEFRGRGNSVVFISHKMDEVLRVADYVTVLRAGAVAGSIARAEATQDGLVRLMVGHDLQLVEGEPTRCSGQVVLSAENLAVFGAAELSLELRAGEIFGIAGVSGNGQDELAEMLCGLKAVRAGRIRLDGQDITHASAAERIEQGLGYVPPDRHRDGLVLSMDVAENLMLKRSAAVPFVLPGAGGRLNLPYIRENAREAVTAYSIRTPDIFTPVKGLSGGNQQKVVVAREMAIGAKALVVFQPTRGLDLGAIDYVHRALLERRDAGVAILLISTELSEVLTLSDRLAVMFRGRLSPVFGRGEAPLARIGALMAGVGLETSDAA